MHVTRTMVLTRYLVRGTWYVIILTALMATTAIAQDAPRFDYSVDADFFQLPEGWNFGQTPGAAPKTDGNILIFTRDAHALLEFDGNGRFVRELGHGLFVTPHGLRVDPQGNIWTTDLGTQLVLKMNPEGRVVMVLGVKNQAGTAIDTTGLYAHLFDRPTDIAFDGNDNVYVADGYGNSRVIKFTPDGEFVRDWGEFGSAPGQFDLPHTIWVDGDDRVWVGDRNNSRIQIFDTDGNVLEVWDHVGRPWGLAHASDGNVWMADGTANRVVKLSMKGEILGSFGEPGRSVGKLGWVHYLTELSDGSLILAEIVSHRASRYLRE